MIEALNAGLATPQVDGASWLLWAYVSKSQQESGEPGLARRSLTNWDSPGAAARCAVSPPVALVGLPSPPFQSELRDVRGDITTCHHPPSSSGCAKFAGISPLPRPSTARPPERRSRISKRRFRSRRLADRNLRRHLRRGRRSPPRPTAGRRRHRRTGHRRRNRRERSRIRNRRIEKPPSSACWQR